MDLRGGKLQPRGRQFSEPARATDAGTPAVNKQVTNNNSEVTRGAHMSLGRSNNKSMKMVAITLVLVIALLAAGFFGWKTMASSNDQANVKSAQFQAVFLTNGQVYFGKLKSVDANYINLSDIFYLQVQQQVQPASTSKSSNSVSLAKLGSELHGPEDSMFIARDQVLFWENLKNNGKVVQAINTYQSQQH